MGCMPSTQTVTAQSTITLPGITQTITNSQTITQSVTSTETITQAPITVIQPPVTLTTTTTAIPATLTATVTTTAPAVTITNTVTQTVAPPVAANDIKMTFVPYTTADINGNVATAQTTYYILTYRNTASVAFNNVRFKLVFTTNIPTGHATIALNVLSGVIPPTTIWTPVVNDNVYSFSMLQSINVPAGDTQQIYFGIITTIAPNAVATYTLAGIPAQISII